ncbi:MAG: DUF1624 domain-containing protein [Brachybacterium paraconglomeratum]|nr:DUF1624 domain-containing protein [Brachybacterium paraconglomeratum]
MKPILSPGRVVGLDIARAAALVGMMATHILPAFDLEGVTTSHQIASGRASALFAVLAGVSIALMSGRQVPHRGRTLAATSAGLTVRALLIAVIGLALGEVDSGIAVILTYYGMLFLLTIPFLRLGAAPLAMLAAGWLVAAPVMSHLVRPHLPPATYDNPTVGSLADPWQLLTELTFTGYYPAVPWLAYALAGMAVGRLALGSWRTTVALGAVGALGAAASTLVSATLLDRPGVTRELMTTFEGPGLRESLALTLDNGLYGTTPTGSWWWLAVDSPHTATPFDLAHTIGTSLLAIAVGVAVGRLAPRLLAVAFGAGAMTLTLYSAHVASRAPGLWDGEDVGTFVGQVAVVLVVGAAYRLARRRGPLEAFVGETQAVVRRAAAGRPPR